MYLNSQPYQLEEALGPVNNNQRGVASVFDEINVKNYRESVCAAGNYVNDVTWSKADWSPRGSWSISRQNLNR